MDLPTFVPRWSNGDVIEICSNQLQRYLFYLIELRLQQQTDLSCWQHFTIEQTYVSGVHAVSILHWQDQPFCEQWHILRGNHLKVSTIDLWIIDYGDVSVLSIAN